MDRHHVIFGLKQPLLVRAWTYLPGEVIGAGAYLSGRLQGPVRCLFCGSVVILTRSVCSSSACLAVIALPGTT